MKTIITRDRIQFEQLADSIVDGNEQDHTIAAAMAWMGVATAFLEDNGGGEARMGYGRDLRKFGVVGDMDLACDADNKGWEAAHLYIEKKNLKLGSSSPKGAKS